jgi:hypothetical protein
MNGSAKKALRVVRRGPRPADQDRPTRVSQATRMAPNDPTGSSVMARMKPIVRMNFRRASAACSQLARAM